MKDSSYFIEESRDVVAQAANLGIPIKMAGKILLTINNPKIEKNELVLKFYAALTSIFCDVTEAEEYRD